MKTLLVPRCFRWNRHVRGFHCPAGPFRTLCAALRQHHAISRRFYCGLMRTLTLALSHPMGEGMAIVRHRLTVGCPANAVAGFSVRRRMTLPLLEERAGVRSSHCFAPSIPLSISAPVAAPPRCAPGGLCARLLARTDWLHVLRRVAEITTRPAATEAGIARR
jgi:hypothetical protein